VKALRFELSCRAWDLLDRFCEAITGGRHFYGPLRFDPVIREEARMCRLCRTSLLPGQVDSDP